MCHRMSGRCYIGCYRLTIRAMAGYGGLSHANIEFFRSHLGDEWTDETLSDRIYDAVTTKPTLYDVIENEAFIEEMIRRDRQIAAARLKQLLTEQRPR